MEACVRDGVCACRASVRLLPSVLLAPLLSIHVCRLRLVDLRSMSCTGILTLLLTLPVAGRTFLLASFPITSKSVGDSE